MKNSLKLGICALISIIVGIGSAVAEGQGLKAGTFIERETQCLARSIYYEARSEPYEGKIAVAQVIVNRSEDDRFPSSICGVVGQRTAFAGKVVCQFSWVCSKGKKAALNIDQFRESLEVARLVLNDGFRLTSVKDALYFQSRHGKLGKGKLQVAKIGNHVFYRDRVRT